MAERQRQQGGGRKAPAPPPPWTQSLTPLNELRNARYKGEDGGLYGGGQNVAPPAHAAAARRLAAEVRPRDASGQPADDGKIGLISVGMSNTTQEFSRFLALANADAAKSPRVVLVDCAQGGQTAMRWADPAAALWSQVDQRLRAAGVTALQVQVAWVKHAEAGPAQYGEFPHHARQLQGNIARSLALLKERFPNLRLAYLSSRIYAGYATTGLNPEPYAYESAFAVRWLIREQLEGRAELNGDPAQGPVRVPLLLWGPYLWADGSRARAGDGLSYLREDLSPQDGTHPSELGRRKVAEQLLTFFKTDATARTWFLAVPRTPP
jgi:hypothetical protein